MDNGAKTFFFSNHTPSTGGIVEDIEAAIYISLFEFVRSSVVYDDNHFLVNFPRIAKGNGISCEITIHESRVQTGNSNRL